MRKGCSFVRHRKKRENWAQGVAMKGQLQKAHGPTIPGGSTNKKVNGGQSAEGNGLGARQ